MQTARCITHKPSSTNSNRNCTLQVQKDKYPPKKERKNEHARQISLTLPQTCSPQTPLSKSTLPHKTPTLY